jgi:hypothetical protein
MMSSYIPLYILLFKTTEDNISEERKLFNKIRELEIENKDLRAKLVPIDDEKLSIRKPLDNEGDDEGDNEGDDEGDNKKTNNLTETFSEELNFERN